MLSPTELVALIAIARLGDDAYAVTIREDVSAGIGRSVSLASVYAALERLDCGRFVRPWLSEPRPERGGRARRQFAITAAGRGLLRREHANALRLWHGVPTNAQAPRR